MYFQQFAFSIIDMDRPGNIESSSFHDTTSPSNILAPIRSKDDQNKRNFDIEQPSIVSEKNDCDCKLFYRFTF